MNHLKLFFFYGAIALLSCNVGDTFAKDYKISKGELLNKIKGALRFLETNEIKKTAEKLDKMLK